MAQKMSKKYIEDTSYKGKNFTEVPLSNEYENCTFTNCDLVGAIFENTILEKADFRTAYNYSINPESNRARPADWS